MNRFDLTAAFRNLLNVAIETGVADAADIFALAATHGTNLEALTDELMNWAFVNRHCPEGMERHAKMCRANDACRVMLVEAPV